MPKAGQGQFGIGVSLLDLGAAGQADAAVVVDGELIQMHRQQRDIVLDENAAVFHLHIHKAFAPSQSPLPQGGAAHHQGVVDLAVPLDHDIQLLIIPLEPGIRYSHRIQGEQVGTIDIEVALNGGILQRHIAGDFVP